MIPQKTLSFLCSLFFLFSVICVDSVQAQPSKRNWGLRFGLNAVSINNYEVYDAGDLLANTSYTNKNGYFITGFARYNIDRFFLQPEIAWNEYRRTCSFSFPVEGANSIYPPINLDINSKNISTNFLVGYNIINDYPFLFGAFFGSSFTGTFRTNYSMETDKTLSKTGFSLNYSGILGFSINISRIYFDLRYEMCLPNADINLKNIPDFPENFKNVKIKKNESILDFSVGMMF